MNFVNWISLIDEFHELDEFYTLDEFHEINKLCDEFRWILCIGWSS